MWKKVVRQFAPVGLYLLAFAIVFPIRAVILEWDPNTETNLAGYNVYYGLGSRDYTWVVRVDAPTTAVTITNLEFNRTYFFAVTAFDTDGLESDFSDEVSTVIPGDTGPDVIPIALGGQVQTFENQARTIVLAGSGADIDHLQFELLSLPSHGTLRGAAPNLIYVPEPGFFGADSFQFRVAYGRAFSAPATLFISVTGMNDQPTLDTIADISVNEDSGATMVSLSGISSGARDEAQKLSVTAISSNPDLIPNPVVSYESPMSIGSLTFAPVADASGKATIAVTVSDGLSAVSRLFAVFVNPVNDPPTLDPISNVTVTENSRGTVVGLSGISSGASNEEQTLTVTAISSMPDLIPNPVVSYYSPKSTGFLVFTPVAGASGTATIAVIVSDGQRSVSRLFSVAVEPVNAPPIVTAGDDQMVMWPASATLTGSATDDGLPKHPGVLTTHWNKLSGPGTVLFDAPDRVASSASVSQPGQYVLQLIANDGALSSTDEVRVVVLERTAPVISDVAVVAMDARSITVQLRTDHPAICAVEFGNTASLGATNVEMAFGADHVLVLTDLEPATNYLFRIRAFDTEGLAAESEIFTATTPRLILKAWAADAGALVDPMSIGSGATGTFVWSPRSEEGAVSFDFQLSTASQYRLWCRVRTLADETGSYYVSIDDGPEFVFDASSADWQTGWRWMAVNEVNDSLGTAGQWVGFLNSGLHRLGFRTHEAITLLRQVILTNDPDWVPH